MCSRTPVLLAAVLLLGLASAKTSRNLAEPGPSPQVSGGTASHIQTVFLIVMAKHNWSSIKGNTNAPYINGTLLPIASHAESYYNRLRIHPDLPNYVYLEAGRSLGIVTNDPPSINHQNVTSHLVRRLADAGISWKVYEESIGGDVCPLTDSLPYVVAHNPFVYFDDMTGSLDPNSDDCIAHIRPFTELALDLQQGTVARYNFIVPNRCNDMATSCDGRNQIRKGDTWLSQNVPVILNSAAYQSGGALFITWDQAEIGDGPIGMIVLSPFARGNGYQNSTYYHHGAMLRTVEEIFGLIPPLTQDIAHDADLSKMFAVFP
ncbi:MAG: phosphoesterase [Acidobacteria bacterium]|nr:MAG: phosphoesterase [Acidobacteriota bacterium]